MTKLALTGAVLFAASALSGCAALESDVTSAASTINQPGVQQALTTIKTVNQALVCDVAAGSSLAKQIEGSVGAHTGVAGEIDVVSSAICSTLGGSLTGATEANVPAVATVTP